MGPENSPDPSKEAEAFNASQAETRQQLSAENQIQIESDFIPYPAVQSIESDEAAQGQSSEPNIEMEGQATEVTMANEQLASESPTYEIEREPDDSLHTSYAKVFLERTLKANPEASEQEVLDMQRVFEEVDVQQWENLTVEQSSRFPGVSFTRTNVRLTPNIIRRMYNRENAEDEVDDSPKPVTQKKTIVLIGSFALPPDGHALSMGDAILDRYIREIGMVANRMDSDNPMEVEIQILGAPTGLGGTVTSEWVGELRSRGLDASAELYTEYLNQALLPPDFSEMTDVQWEAALQGQEFLFQGASRGGIIADKIYGNMPPSVQNLSQRRLDNPAGHHGDARLWVLKGAQIGIGLGKEFAKNMKSEDSPLGELMSNDKKLYEDMARKLSLSEGKADQVKKWAAVGAEALALGRGETLEEEAASRFVVHAIEDELNPYDQATDIRRQAEVGTVGTVMHQTDEGAEFMVEGGHFFSPYEGYQQKADGSLGTWWNMVKYGRLRADSGSSKEAK